MLSDTEICFSFLITNGFGSLKGSAASLHGLNVQLKTSADITNQINV